MSIPRVRFSKYVIYPGYFGPVLEDQVRDFIYDLDKFLVQDLCLNYPKVEFKLDISMRIPHTRYPFYNASILTYGFNEEVDSKKAEIEQLGFVDEGAIIKSSFGIFDRQNGIAKPDLLEATVRYQLVLSSVGHPEISRSNFELSVNSAGFTLDFDKGFDELKRKYSFIV